MATPAVEKLVKGRTILPRSHDSRSTKTGSWVVVNEVQRLVEKLPVTSRQVSLVAGARNRQYPTVL
jgi:uncharacterized protein (DUF111 family)